MTFNESDEFTKDFKRLSKKYKTLSDDLLEFKKVISLFPLGTGRHFVILHSLEQIKIIKARLFCRYLRGASLRIIYAHKEPTTVEFVELYFKGEQENENRERIKEYLKNNAHIEPI